MSLKRLVLSILLAAAGAAIVPQGAAALSFAPSAGSPITIASPNDQVNYAATADLDGNGKDDVISVGNSAGIYVFLSNDQGTGFSPAPGSPFGMTGFSGGRASVFTGQFGGGSETDLLVMNYSYPRTFETYLGHGDGTFGSTPDFTYTAPQPDPYYPGVISSGSVGDVNGDGWPDIVAGMTRRHFMVALGSSTGQLTDAPGSPFLVPPSIVNPSGSFTTTAIGDFNGDGDPDVAVGLDDGTNSSPGVYVAEGDGTGAFTSTGTPAVQLGMYMWPSSLSAIDLNGDQYDDLAVDTPNSNSVSTLIGSSAGLASNPAPGGTVLLSGDYPYALAVADFNNDGLEDVGVANRGTYGVSVLKSAGDGNLAISSGSPFPLPQVNGKNFAANTLATGDFNGDGAPDLASTSTHSGDTNQARGIDVLVSKPEAAVSPSALDFPATAVDHVSDPLTVTVKNSGAPDLTIGSITKSGSSPDRFAVDSSDCPAILTAGDECDIEVKFAPGGVYAAPTAELNIAFGGGVSTAVVSLTGHTPPHADFTPADGLSFGESISGYQPDEKTLRIRFDSVGGGDLEPGTAVLSGFDADDFEIINPEGCDSTFAPGDRCSIDVKFSPTATAGGLREASLDFPDTNDGDPYGPIPLNGYARKAEYTVQPASYDFGEAKIGAGITRTPKTFTVSSTGAGKVPFSGVGLDGADAGSFAVTANNCPEMLAAVTGSCSVSVVFDPKQGEAGTRIASLVVDAFSSTHEGATQIALTGKAAGDPTPLAKPKLTMKLKSARAVKRGKVLVLTATVKNTGKAAAKPLSIKATAPAKLAKAPKPVKVASLAPGKQITKKLKLKTKKFAGKKTRKLKVKVVAASGTVKRTATRVVKLR